jgi:hypothetical protein
MSPTIIEDLRKTVIGKWHTRLADNKSPRRNHWQTKIVYFRSAAELLTAQPGHPLTWKSIVAAATPRGCRSTFYEVAGAHARHRMIDDLIGDGQPDSIQIALRYLRADPVEQLIDETKVWSYWPYRHHLLSRILTAGMTHDQMEDALTRSLTSWARRNESLAAALNHSPPACAVEDLTVLCHGRLAAMRAASQLSDVLRHATAPRS